MKTIAKINLSVAAAVLLALAAVIAITAFQPAPASDTPSAASGALEADTHRLERGINVNYDLARHYRTWLDQQSATITT